MPELEKNGLESMNVAFTLNTQRKNNKIQRRKEIIKEWNKKSEWKSIKQKIRKEN